MKKRNNNYLELIFAGFVGLVLGVIINKIIIDFPFFVVDKNLNLFQLLAICSPIVVAIYINAIITRNNEISNHSKKIFIDKCSEVDNLIENLMDFVETKAFDFYKFLSITTRIHRCLKLMKKHQILTDKEFAEYFENLIDFKDKSTVTSEDVVIKKGIVEIKSTSLSYILDSMDRLRNRIFEKKLQIIREYISDISKNKKDN